VLQTDRQTTDGRATANSERSLKTIHQNFTKFSVHVIPVAVAWSSSDDREIRYVLPVLWMTSRFSLMGIGAWRWHRYNIKYSLDI